MAPGKRQIDLTKLGNQESKNDAEILYIIVFSSIWAGRIPKSSNLIG